MKTFLQQKYGSLGLRPTPAKMSRTNQELVVVGSLPLLVWIMGRGNLLHHPQLGMPRLLLPYHPANSKYIQVSY